MNLNMLNSSPINEANKSQMANIVLLQGGVESTQTFDCNFKSNWRLNFQLNSPSKVGGQLQTHIKLVAAFTGIISTGGMLRVGISFQAPYFSSTSVSGGELDAHSILRAIFIDKYGLGGSLVIGIRLQGGVSSTSSLGGKYKLSLVYNPAWFSQTSAAFGKLKLNQRLQIKTPTFDTQEVGGLLRTGLVLDAKFNDTSKGSIGLVTHIIFTNFNTKPENLTTGGNFKSAIYLRDTAPTFSVDVHSAGLRLNNILTQPAFVSDVSFSNIGMTTHCIFGNKNTPIDKIKADGNYRLSYRLFGDFENIHFVRGNYILNARLLGGQVSKESHGGHFKIGLSLYNEMIPETNFMDSKDFKANILFESGMINNLDSMGAKFKISLSEPMINTMWLSIRSATDRYSIKTPKGDI